MAKTKGTMPTVAPNTLANGQFEIPGFLFTTKTNPENPAAKTELSVTKIKNVTPQVPQPAQTDNATPPAPSLTTLPREELLEYIFQSTCNPEWRRWERELYFGATDEELATAMGHSYHSGGELNLAFRTDSEPILTVTYRVFDVPVTTASGPECAAYIRRIVGIPERKSPEEHAALLTRKLDEIRIECRNHFMYSIRSMTGEKFNETRRPKKAKKGKKAEEDVRPPSVAEQIASLLFADDCLTEASDRRLLITITRLLHRKANVDLLKAAENAVSLIKRAKENWKSSISYWIEEDKQPSQSAYQPGKEPGSDPAPPE